MQPELFALGSSLYEVLATRNPYEGLEEESILSLFGEGRFRAPKGFCLEIIMGCRQGEVSSAKAILDFGKESFEPKQWRQALGNDEK